MTDNVFWPLQRPEDIPKNQTNWPTFAPPQWQTFTPPLTIVEQNAVAALNLADRAVILDTGKVVFDGTAKEVLDNEELRHEYLAI